MCFLMCIFKMNLMIMIIKLNDFFDLLIVELEFMIVIRYKLILMKNVLKFFFLCYFILILLLCKSYFFFICLYV